MKYISTTILNTALEYIRNNTDIIHLCSSAPTEYSTIATYSLGSASMSITDFSITKTGIVSGGRRISIKDIEVTATSSGSITCVVIADSTETDLFYISEVNVTSIINGSVYEIKEWDIEFRSPV